MNTFLIKLKAKYKKSNKIFVCPGESIKNKNFQPRAATGKMLSGGGTFFRRISMGVSDLEFR